MNCVVSVAPLRNYDWQDRAVSSLLQASGHFYVNAPTGTGKTNFMFKAIDALPGKGACYILVGMNTLVDQHRARFIELGAEACDEEGRYLMPSGREVVITTWQSASRSRRLVQETAIDVLFFDECHIGGSNEENVCIPVIFARFNPRLKVYVSATMQTASEILLGVKDGHTFNYSLAEAYEDGLLHPVDLVEVQTGVSAEVERIEKTTGVEIENLEEWSEERLDALTRRLKQNNVAFDAKSFERIVDHRHDAMIEIYMERHAEAQEQALFFCSEIRRAEAASARFNEFANLKGLPVASGAVHNDERNSADLIQQFRKGKIAALFVVGMLQEGFDMPTLHLAFDCRFFARWNASKVARFTQKIGRLIRPAVGKGTSLYYYARDVSDFYNPKLRKQRNPGEPDFDGDDSEDFDAAAIFAASVAAGSAADDDDVIINPSLREDIEVDSIQGDASADAQSDLDVSSLRPRRVARSIVTTPLYVLRDVRDFSVTRQFEFGKLFNRTFWHAEGVREECEAWIARAASGEDRPKRGDEAARLRLLIAGQKHVPADFIERLKKANRSWVKLNADDIREECEEWIERAKRDQRPVSRREGARLQYLMDRHPLAPTHFKKCMEDTCPHWFRMPVKDFELEEWIARAATNEKRPHMNSKEGKRLANLLSGNIKGVPEWFKTRLRDANEEWFAPTIDGEAEAAYWLERARNEPARPEKGSDDDVRLTTFIAARYRPDDFLIRLKETNPTWAKPRRKKKPKAPPKDRWTERRIKVYAAIAVECEEWIRRAAMGEQRPARGTKDGKRLNYLLKPGRAHTTPPGFHQRLKNANSRWFR